MVQFVIRFKGGIKVFTAEDKGILMSLSAQVFDIAHMPEQAEKRELWKKHTSLRGNRPPVFVSPEGSWTELIGENELLTTDAFARDVERELRKRIFRFQHIGDDTPIENSFDIPISSIPVNRDWGLEYTRRDQTGRGSWGFQPVIEKPSDWKKLKKPDLYVDEKDAIKKVKELTDACGQFLNVKLTGIKVIDYHIAHIYCDFRGLDNMLVDLIDEENMVKDVFAFFAEGLRELTEKAARAGLIECNNDYTYHYTGGLGYTNDLPDESGKRVPLSHVWAAAEAQEFSCVSPEMFAEFIYPYDRALLSPFGLTGYGCCDDLTEKLDAVLTLQNLRRVAACPWANLEKMAKRLKKDYILTWKPNPAHLAGECFDEKRVFAYMKKSLEEAKAGYPEIILRDTHTVRGEKGRFTDFVKITRRAIDEVYG